MTTGTWERLGVGDLMTLWAQVPAMPMNIALAGLLDAAPVVDGAGRLRLTELRAAVAARLDRAPALRRRIQHTHLGQGRPLWVDDAAFDITRHVQTARLAGADVQTFLSRAATWAAGQLDRRRPLWRLTFVTGLDSGDVGVVIVVHHAVADGVGGAALAAALLDATPDEQPRPRGWTPLAPPRAGELIRDAVADRLAGMRRLVGHERRRHAMGRELRDNFAAVLAKAPALDLPAPASPVRRLATVSWPLERARRVAQAHDATINDVVLSVVAAGMRRLLIEREYPTDGLEMRVSVPVAAPPGSRNAGGTLPMVLALPVVDPYPPRTLARVSARTRRAKAARDRTYPGLPSSPLVPLSLVRPGIRLDPFTEAVRQAFEDFDATAPGSSHQNQCR